MRRDKTVVLWSVPHTGTNFLRRLLLDHNIDVKSAHYEHKGHGSLNVDQLKNYMKKMPNIPVVAPIRNPRDQWLTFYHRDQKAVDLRESWEAFNKDYLENPNLIILPIDTPEREYYLKRMSTKLGRELTTDWRKRASKASEYGPDPEVPDLSWIYDLEVVKKFYPSI